MKRLFRILLIFSALTLGVLLIVYLINRRIQSFAVDRVHNSATEIPAENPPPVAIVFGAGVWKNGEPSPVLYDRVVTAVELYRAQRVKKILMSGDNRFVNYDEPTAMKQTAVKLGVPESDVVLDFAGRRTYDTCWRAKEIFGVERAILVTQEFHQARALYLCNNLGVESAGVVADRRAYEGEKYWSLREFFSVASAWTEINVFSFEPVGGEKEFIKQN